MLWGTTKWGENSRPMDKAMQHVFSCPVVTSGFVFSKDVVHYVADSAAVTNALTKQPYFTISETLTLVADMGAESLSDAAGYKYVFPDRVTDGEDRSFATWASAAAAGGTWSTAAAATTTWSDA